MRAAALAVCLCAVAPGLGGCGEDDEPVRVVAPAVAGSAEEAGGMDALVRAAKEEGTLHTTTLLRHWANYGGLMDGFEKKYGIEIVNSNPFGSSQEEIEDIKRNRGKASAPDVLDLGDAFAQSAAREGLLAPYRVAPWDSIPANQKDPDGAWFNSYGGYVSIGCDQSRVAVCPASFADLLKPEYRGMVALNGNPTTAGSAFAGVYAAALANGGSFDDIQPGIDFFEKLRDVGNYNRGNPNPEAIVRGETPISIEWDFLNLRHVDELRGTDVRWKVSIPFDGSFSQYYAQAINKHAPHPAAARLWMEYLASAEGQNLRLGGYARPVLMDVMAKDGTLDEEKAARLPTVEGSPPAFPGDAQLNEALRVVRKSWSEAVGE
ncbi:ABC transporter substrate-binding protein [Streptomyces roseolus]|uniref:ABC transporter substrate-binding protein n=1 Tax=Streptomyces roseolus TaxID=67358 RepID=UPI00167A41C6|nr:ABC transporter substrate-binding protein [Streptomyces roseolus]